MLDKLDKNEYMEDAKGRLVPKENIEEIDLTRDDLVNDLIQKGLNLQEDMKAFKENAMAEVKAFIELSANEYDVEIGGKKGNVTLMSFNGKYKIQVAVADNLVFDERLKVAKKKIDECLQEWTEGGNTNIKTLVDDVFQVDREGNLSTQRILELRRYKIEDPLWKEAMEIIGKSLQVVSSKEYFRLYQRNPADQRWNGISLDIAAL